MSWRTSSTACASGMSRSGADRGAVCAGRCRLRAAAALAVLALYLPAGGALAQGVAGGVAIELTPAVQDSLLDLQEGWLQWTSALYGGDPERARGVLDGLLRTADRLGMPRLPDLASGAMAQAIEAARQGDENRAALALAAAERLDPGHPTRAFAAARVARIGGRPLDALGHQLRAYARLAALGGERTVVLWDLLLWALISLLLAGGLFVAVQMAIRGPALLTELSRLLARRVRFVPAPGRAVLVALALFWPLALPGAVLWLLFYWSLLLWRQAGGRERAVFAVVWLFAGLVPAAFDEARAVSALALSPPVRAMQAIADGRLYGALFIDLGVLPASLPDHPGVDQLLADLDARLGQWDAARSRYQDVLEKEPENVAALIDLGAYYFTRGDHGAAVSYFQQAAVLAPDNAAAQFNLSQAYAETYLFDEQRAALTEARRLDDLRVTEWLRRGERQRVVTAEGGIGRIGELERALRKAWSPASGAPSALVALRRLRPLLSLAALAGLAIALHVTLGRAGPTGAPATPASGLGGWLPGMAAAADGRAFSAFAGLSLVAALVTTAVAATGRLGLTVPWQVDPGGWFLALIAATGALTILAWEAILQWRRG